MANYMMALKNGVAGPGHFASLAVVVTVVPIDQSDPLLAHVLSFVCIGVGHWCAAMLTIKTPITLMACCCHSSQCCPT